MYSFIKDLIFPKRCVGCNKFGRYLCDECFTYIEIYQEYVCPACLKHSVIGKTHPSCIKPSMLDGLSCGVVYKGVVKKLLYRYKYAPFLSDLASIIGEICTETLSQNELFMRVLSSHPIVVEVPLSQKRFTKRGYNQSELLARELSKNFKLEFIPKLLIRNKMTIPQFSLHRVERLKNVKDAFEINLKYKKAIPGETFFLIDDVATSCATLKECAKVLKRNGARHVYGVTFAREI